MKSTYLVPSKRNDNEKVSTFSNTTVDKTFLNCVIANDASKKIDFLFLVIETLQINATDTLFLKAKNIGLSEEFSCRVQFWKMRCSNPLRKSYTYSNLTADQIDSFVELISAMADNLYPLIRQ